MKIDSLAWEFNSWIIGMRAFVDAISRASSKTAAEEAADRLKRHAESEGWPADDYFAEDDMLEENFEHWLPRLSAYSIIILLHSVAETQLNTCADRLRRDRALTLPLKDLHGQGVLRAKTYIVKVANLDIAHDPGWQELSNLQGIRNIIVHRRGRVDSHDQRELVQRLIKEYPDDVSVGPVRSHGIVSINEQEISLTFRLCSHFLEEIEVFFKRLFEAAGFQKYPIQI